MKNNKNVKANTWVKKVVKVISESRNMFRHEKPLEAIEIQKFNPMKRNIKAREKLKNPRRNRKV